MWNEHKIIQANEVSISDFDHLFESNDQQIMPPSREEERYDTKRQIFDYWKKIT